MRLSRLVLVVLCAFPMLSCSNGGECDRCSSNDDCKQDFQCTEFSDGSRRCGSGEGVTTCRTIR